MNLSDVEDSAAAMLFSHSALVRPTCPPPPMPKPKSDILTEQTVKFSEYGKRPPSMRKVVHLHMTGDRGAGKTSLLLLFAQLLAKLGHQVVKADDPSMKYFVRSYENLDCLGTDMQEVMEVGHKGFHAQPMQIWLHEPSTPLEEGRLIVGVVGCARCGGFHPDVQFYKLRQPSDEWTHYAACPENNEPIMLKMKETDKEHDCFAREGKLCDKCIDAQHHDLGLDTKQA